jgi:hypothetical protein
MNCGEPVSTKKNWVKKAREIANDTVGTADEIRLLRYLNAAQS